MENEVAIWSQRSRSFFRVPVDNLDDHGSFVTTVAMDSAGLFCAVGTRTGAIALWRLDKGVIAERKLLRHPSSTSRIIDIAIEDKPAQKGNRPSMLHRRSLSGDISSTDGFILVTFKNGTVIEWTDLYDPKPVILVDGSHSVGRPVIIRSGPHDALMFVTIANDGTVQLFTRDTNEWHQHTPFIAGTSTDAVHKIHAKLLTIELSPRIIIATATKAGQVSLWDGTSGDRWFTLEETVEDINRLRLSFMPSKSCPTCAKPMPDAFTLTVSSGTIAIIHRFSVDNAGRCSCLILQPPSVSHILRSRQSSLTALAPPPLRHKNSALSASATNVTGVADFPVSAHGVHSRRGSERDPPRRPESGFYLNDEAATDLSDCVGPPLHHTKLVEVSFQEGAWDTLGHIIYGLRRSTELETLEEDPQDEVAKDLKNWTPQFEGLERPVLERWKLWVFDPTSPDLSVQESSLASLVPSPCTEPNGNGTTLPPQQPRSSLHNRNTMASISTQSQSLHSSKTYLEPSAFPRLPFTEVSSLISLGNSSCLVAFGNTIGLVTFSPIDTPSSSVSTRTYHSRASSAATAVLYLCSQEAIVTSCCIDISAHDSSIGCVSFT